MNDVLHNVKHEQDEFEVVAELRVRIHRSGALSVAGCIDHEQYAIACLEQAIEAVKRHHKRFELVVPSKDSGVIT
jgi:hypothetical protein